MVSPRKSSSASSFVPEERKLMPSSTKSCESLYSSASSCKGSATALYRRKSSLMGGANNRQPTIIPATTEVRKRVLSARRLRVKTYQNQLIDAQQTIAELVHENRILRTLHKRQDSALAKYESTNAELPQLLHSHAEELRVWQTKYRNLQTSNKDLEHKIKQKESIILSLSDQNKYYSQLNKDKNLDERQRLSEKCHALEALVQEKDNDMKLFARKVQLETKNMKQQLQNEQRKTKDAILKLERARLELSGYRKLDELNLPERFSNVIPRRKPPIIIEEEPKLEKELEKILEAPEFANTTIEEVDYAPSQRSVRSNMTTNVTSSRTIRNQSGTMTQRQQQQQQQSQQVIHLHNKQQQQQQSQPQKPQVHQQHQQKSVQQQQLQQQQRRIDRGDGDAPTITELRKTSIQQMQHQQRQKIQQPNILSTTENSAVDYDDDYSNDFDDIGNIDSDLAPAEETETDTYSEQTFTTKETLNSELDVGNDGDEDDGEDIYDGNDADNALISTSVRTTSTRMKEEICSIRKQISDDYKEREAFLDTFCRQASGSALRDEILTPIKRNSVSVTSHNLPNNRKHKLLAALKAIDNNKSQD